MEALRDGVATLLAKESAWSTPQLTAVPSAAAAIVLEDLLAAADTGGITASLLYWDVAQVVQRLTSQRYGRSRAPLQAVLEGDGNLLFKDAHFWLPRAAKAAQAVHEETLLGSVHANIYVARAGLPIARAAHTDPGAIFVLQTSGSKRWRVWPPPAPRPGTHPLRRGQGADELASSELVSPPLIDARLTPGTLLYVPAGFAHATDTGTDADNDTDAGTCAFSVHVTLGIQTHLDGLTMLSLVPDALQRAQRPVEFEPDLSHLAAPAQRRAALEQLLVPPRLLGALRGGDEDEDAYEAFAAQLVGAVRAAAPEALRGLPADGDDEAAAWWLGVPHLASRLEEHAARLVAEERRRLRSVAAGSALNASVVEAEKDAARLAMREWFAHCAHWEAAGVCTEQRDALQHECPGACAARTPAAGRERDEL